VTTGPPVYPVLSHPPKVAVFGPGSELLRDVAGVQVGVIHGFDDFGSDNSFIVRDELAKVMERISPFHLADVQGVLWVKVLKGFVL
jgi:hypothetical protein